MQTPSAHGTALPPSASCSGSGPGVAVVGGVCALSAFVAVVVPHAPSTTAPWTVLLPLALAYGVFACISVVLVDIDLRTHRLPHRITGAAFLLGLLLFALAAAGGAGHLPLLRALAAAAVLAAAHLVLALLPGGVLGGGDVRLAGVIALHLGWRGLEEAVLAACGAFVLGGAAALVLLCLRRAGRRSRIAFGPAMLAAAWSVLLLGGVPPGTA